MGVGNMFGVTGIVIKGGSGWGRGKGKGYSHILEVKVKVRDKERDMRGIGKMMRRRGKVLFFKEKEQEKL